VQGGGDPDVQPSRPAAPPWARIGEFVGQRNLAVTANTYSHVLVDEAEVEYAALPGAARPRRRRR
jgi:hypothetical protein